jgi:hypothetical protein
MSRKTLKTIATLAAVLATAVVPAASAASVDMRSPDARDAATVVAASNGQDLRSPDARDVSRPSTGPVSSPTPSDGTDWGEVGLIAGAVLVALLGAGGLILVSRRRGTMRKSGATVAPS